MEPTFDAAVAAGADGIEFDVQLSKDGVPVIWHDRTLSRAGGGRRRTADLTAAELATLDAGRLSSLSTQFGAIRLPTLRQVLLRYRGKTRLLVEIKSRERDRRSGRKPLHPK